MITCLVETGMSAIDIAEVVRHSSLNSQLHYAQATGKRAANRVSGIQASTGAPPPKKRTVTTVPTVTTESVTTVPTVETIGQESVDQSTSLVSMTSANNSLYSHQS